MLDFQVEWPNAPGVKVQVLAKTWARLEIHLQAEGTPPRWLTSCIRTRSNSVQRGVYGSVFSLAEWIVENWWFLLHEPLRVPEYQGGRAVAVDDPQRRWAQRHDLLAAREGGALPDLTFYRDGPDVVACWFPDPEQDEQIRPTRFISGAGTVRMAPCDLVIALHDFVETVLERLDQASDEDTQRLRATGRLFVNRAMRKRICAPGRLRSVSTPMIPKNSRMNSWNCWSMELPRNRSCSEPTCSKPPPGKPWASTSTGRRWPPRS